MLYLLKSKQLNVVINVLKINKGFFMFTNTKDIDDLLKKANSDEKIEYEVDFEVIPIDESDPYDLKIFSTLQKAKIFALNLLMQDEERAVRIKKVRYFKEDFEDGYSTWTRDDNYKPDEFIMENSSEDYKRVLGI